MSIRYTLRHNIPSALIEKEDVNDSSTWDLNLLRKHEIAETDNHDIVYRQHNGEIVNWTEGATQRATAILQAVREMMEHIEDIVGMSEEELQQVSEILHNSQIIIQEAIQSRQEAEKSKNLARDWAIKMDGKVKEDGLEIDYSSKYYAQQVNDSIDLVRDSVEYIQEYKDQFDFLKHFRIVDGHLFQVVEV